MDHLVWENRMIFFVTKTTKDKCIFCIYKHNYQTTQQDEYY